jgi:lysyl-tRNA synthetase class 2
MDEKQVKPEGQTQAPEMSLNDQEQARQAKLAKYVELGVDPFGSRYAWKDQIRDIREKYGKLTAEELTAKAIDVNVAGRLVAIRRMGKASFVNLKDEYGTIQAWIGINVIGEHDYNVFKLADLGDIVGLEGTLMLTRTGELTIRVSKYTHITKCLKPLPEKFHGLTDTEDRFRKRYLDLIVNDESRQVALMRPKIVRGIQKYCDDQGFVEVETSIFSPILGGAAAKPFITHFNALDKDFYLRIATELNLKKCMVGGIDRVYEIGRIFRNEGIDAKHNPEFTTIELYQAYGDLSDMRSWLEGLFHYIADKVVGKQVFKFNGHDIDVSKPFAWVDQAECIKAKTGVDFKAQMTFEEAVALAKKFNVPLEKAWNSVGYIQQAFFDELCEADCIQPTFIHTYPIEVSPLTKKTADPRFVDRFELFIGGTEFGNAYSELNNPFDQKERFEAQLAAKQRGDDEANEMDLSFLDALSYGMPPAGGIGVGIDRFTMFFTEQDNIREVLLFPTMKDEK